MPGAASPEEAVFTGVDDPTASPVAQEFIKKLQAQGMQPTASNIRRLVEANARGTGQAGPDLVEGVRNDVVENSARPVARHGGGGAPVNPPMVNMGATANEGPGTDPTPKAPVPVVDPESGQVVSPEGGDFNANIGAIIAGAVPLLYGLSRVPGINRMFPGGPNLSGVTLNPTPNALPAPPPTAPPQIAAPQARLPAPAPTAQPTTSAPPPAAAPTAPPVINMPPPAEAPLRSPSMIRGTPPAGRPDPAILDRLKGQIGNRLKLGAGIPFIMESPQDIMSRWKK